MDQFVTPVSHYTAQVELNSQLVYSDSDLTDILHNSQLDITEGGDFDDEKIQNYDDQSSKFLLSSVSQQTVYHTKTITTIELNTNLSILFYKTKQ